MRQVLVFLLASLATGLTCFGGEPPKTRELDRFGGWKGKQFEATGYFRTEHDGRRWWLVTPEGNAFLSLGINHYHPGWWAQDYNREHWVKEFGADRPWDQAWQKGFRDRAIADCRRLGFSTLGFHSEAPMLIDPPLGPVMPYIRQYEPVRFSSWRNPKPEAYVDIFSPEFESHCDVVARKLVRPYADDPMILGFAMADVPVLSDMESRRSKGTTWPRVLRNLGADAPGKQAYVSTMRARYPNVDAFNEVYDTEFPSWDAMAAAEDWRPETDFANQAELDDNMKFLRRCVDRYYAVAKAAFRRYDSNHMFLGDKLNGNGDALDHVVDITGRHTDLILVQCYGRWEYQGPRLDLWSSKVDKPLLNGDSSYGVPGEMLPNPLGNPHCQARSQAERAAWTREFAESAFARCDFVGWHICGIIDTWKTMPGKEQWQHCGLMTPTGEFYPEMEEAIQDLSSRLYEIATHVGTTDYMDSRNGANEHAVEIRGERLAQIAAATTERRKRRASQPAQVARKPNNPQPAGDDAQFNAWVAPYLEQLDLTDGQRPRFLDIQKQMTQKWAEFQRMPSQERQAKQGPYYRARHAELEELLSKEQMAKFLDIQAARAGQTVPRRKPEPSQRESDSPLSSTRPDYSGKYVHGIESIVKEAEGGAESWRQAAEKRIDRLRKADLVLRIVDEQGRPLSGVPVRIQQTRHLFRFGGIVGGQSMHEPAPGQKPRRISPEQYKEMFLELGFNAAGFNKYLKYKQRPRSEPHLPALFAWFQEHDIPVRGHCLMWPGGVWMNFMPPELSEMVYVPDPSIDWSGLKKGVPREKLTPSEKQAVRELCKKMVEEASRQWPVFEWDVINETRDNHVVQDLVGKDVIVDWFRFARQNAVDKDAGLYLNEYRVISDPSPEVITHNMKRYEEEIRYLLENGAPISGIGFQSRFHAKTPPETIYKRLCYFEQFNLPYAATEFEMNDTVGNEFERAAMTERAVTVLSSHRLVNGIYAWSLLAQDQGGPGHRAILEDDGRLKLRGKVWMSLMKNRWWTDESLTSASKLRMPAQVFF